MKGRAGFTLIELLVVVVVLGLLASIALVRTSRATNEARKASVEADMKLVALHEEIFHNLNYRYGAITELADYTAGPGVTVELTWLDSNGFAMRGIHAGSESLECGYYIGTAPDGTTGPAVQEGRITCN